MESPIPVLEVVVPLEEMEHSVKAMESLARALEARVSENLNFRLGSCSPFEGDGASDSGFENILLRIEL